KKAVVAWLQDQKDLLDGWRKKQSPVPETVDFTTTSALDDLAVDFFTRFAKLHPTHWPVSTKDKEGDVLEAKPVTPDANIEDLQAVMFDSWHTANPDRAALIEPVPADLVLASGSGLDPHITWKAALYQLPIVVAARLEKSRLTRDALKQHILEILEKHSS